MNIVNIRVVTIAILVGGCADSSVDRHLPDDIELGQTFATVRQNLGEPTRVVRTDADSSRMYDLAPDEVVWEYDVDEFYGFYIRFKSGQVTVYADYFSEI